jgi:hypothetical protein
MTLHTRIISIVEWRLFYVRNAKDLQRINQRFAGPSRVPRTPLLRVGLSTLLRVSPRALPEISTAHSNDIKKVLDN